MLKIGSYLDGKYKILNKIGQGGMSVVYMAINEKANKTWAVKEVRRSGVLDFETVRQGLIAETDILKNLSHPNLPSIVDVIDTDDSFIIIMDYIEGNTLYETLQKYGAQPQSYVIEWAKQLCDVLGYLHSRPKPIIYRDLKPSNIMLKPDGNVMLIDFGTAREYKTQNIADTTCLGTYGYAAPEQFKGHGQSDARTDIFGLGRTLYHLVTGNNPSEPPYEIKPIRQINPALSGGFENIILKCTQEDPALRYQSAAELMYALEHFEEIDDKYRKKQKSKMTAFITISVLACAFAAGGFALSAAAKNKASNTYEAKIEEAYRSSDYDEKLNLFEECIELPNQSGRADAYLGIIQTFKDDDSVLSVEEAQLLEKLISNNKDELIKEPVTYTEICFETGKLFWYYYNYGDGSGNQITRAKSSSQWFDEALANAPDGYENEGMAMAYSSVGKFYRDITTDITEANDKGKYEPLYENLLMLMDTVAADEAESEIVRLEIIEMARSAIQQYVTKFKADGITEAELTKLYEKVEDSVNNVDTTVDKTTEKKDEIIGLLHDTLSAVKVAYNTIGGD